MDVLIGVGIGILAVLAVPIFFVLRWLLGPIWMGDKKGGRGFH